MTNVRNVLTGSIVSSFVAVIAVSCGGGGYGSDGGTPTYSVGGTLSGATGTVVLQLNGGSNLSISGNGPFTFAAMIANGGTYNVTAAAPNQRCTVANGAGTMGVTNIANVSVACGAQTTETVVRSALLSGAQENPPVATSATGVGGVIVDPATRAITGGMTFAGLTPTAGGHHIHQAPAGDPTNNGPVIIGLTLASDGLTAFVPPGTTLTAPQYAALLAGELYFNVHTVANSNGEIRGQINMQGGVHANAASLTAGQEVPAGTSTATGTGALLVDKATRRILISYITHNVANASMAHIHTSPSGAGSTGPVIVGFGTLQTNFDGLGNNLAYPTAGSQMTAQNVADLLVSYLYFNVHSTNNLCPPAADCGAGEIRGNIAPIP
jgi:hypothetical protein